MERDDYRQRCAEVLAAKFTEPRYRCDRDGENEWVENPEPADRIDQTPRVVFTAGDGHPSVRTPTCAELAEAIAAVRDQDAETLRSENEDLRKRAELAEANDPALAEIERLATDLYKAQDALAFVAECCDIADRYSTPVTTALVREWLEGAKCGRRLLAERKADRG